MGWFSRLVGRKAAAGPLALPPAPLPPQAQRTVKPTIRNPADDLDPSVINRAYKNAVRGDPADQIALWDDLLERDATSRDCFNGLASAVSQAPWTILPGGPKAADRAAAEKLKADMAEVPNMSAAIDHWSRASGYGWACSETTWGFDRRGRRIVPRLFAHLHPDRFLTEPNTDELLLRTVNRMAGESLAPGGWVVVKAPGTLPLARRGLMRTVGILSALKLWITKNWVAYTLRFGIPFVAAKVSQFTDQVSRDIAEEIVSTFGDDGGAVHPPEIELAITQAAAQAIHEQIVNYLNSEISKAVYGATLANDNRGGSSSYALGSLHGRVRWEKILAVAGMVSASFSECVARPYVEWNGLNAAPPRLHIHCMQSLSPSETVQIASMALNELGVDLSKQQIREQLGFRPPADASDTLTPKELRKLAAGVQPDALDQEQPESDEDQEAADAA